MSGSWLVAIEALALWQKSSPTPTPIITDGPLGRTGTSTLLGGGDLDTNPSPGFRLSATYALNARRELEGSFFVVDRRSATRSVSSSGELRSTNLLLPYFDVNARHETATEISFAGEYSGSATEQLGNRLMGAEANLVWPIADGPTRISLFTGFRWLQLEETYSIGTSSPAIAPRPKDVWNTIDLFETSNNFYGAQMGIRARYDLDRWYGVGSLKLALGGMVQKVDIGGSLETNDFTGLGAPRTYTGGYFALPSNIGTHRHTEFSVIPEVALKIGYRITPAMSIIASYGALYATNVVRPGNQLNRNINPTQSVALTGAPVVGRTGPAQPLPSLQTSNYWAQSISIGIEARF